MPSGTASIGTRASPRKSFRLQPDQQRGAAIREYAQPPTGRTRGNVRAEWDDCASSHRIPRYAPGGTFTESPTRNPPQSNNYSKENEEGGPSSAAIGKKYITCEIGGAEGGAYGGSELQCAHPGCGRNYTGYRYNEGVWRWRHWSPLDPRGEGGTFFRYRVFCCEKEEESGTHEKEERLGVQLAVG